MATEELQPARRALAHRQFRHRVQSAEKTHLPRIQLSSLHKRAPDPLDRVRGFVVQGSREGVQGREVQAFVPLAAWGETGDAGEEVGWEDFSGPVRGVLLLLLRAEEGGQFFDVAAGEVFVA